MTKQLPHRKRKEGRRGDKKEEEGEGKIVLGGKKSDTVHFSFTSLREKIEFGFSFFLSFFLSFFWEGYACPDFPESAEERNNVLFCRKDYGERGEVADR